MDRIVIVMPTFNERENIGWMIDELCAKEFPKIKNAETHLLVVDANSPDGTADVVRSKQAKYKNLHLLSKNKEGLGADYIAGFKYAMKNLKADALVEMDADGQHPPRFIVPMVQAYLEGADYVIGSRYIKGGSIPKEWAFFRKFISYAGNLFIRLVLLKPNIHDLTTGFRLTRVRGVMDKIDLDNLMEKERFAYKVDLLYQSVKNAKKVVEIPLQFAPRSKEKSKFKPAEMVSTFKVAIILGIRDKQRFIKFAIVGFIGYLVNALGLNIFASLKFPEWAIWACATELAIINNFLLNNIWTFRSQKITGWKTLPFKFLEFNLTSTGALLIQTIFGTLGVSLFGEDKRQLLLPIIIVFLVLPYNYFMYNTLIWKTWKFSDLRKIFSKKS